MWLHKVAIKHLLSEGEDHETVQSNMIAIADTLKKKGCFSGFDTNKFYNIPEGDEFFGPVDYANVLLSQMYDYADFNRIWID